MKKKKKSGGLEKSEVWNGRSLMVPLISRLIALFQIISLLCNNKNLQD